jgi:hypothetical protein
MGPNASLSDRTLILTALTETGRRADNTEEDVSLRLRRSISTSTNWNRRLATVDLKKGGVPIRKISAF